MDTEKRHRSRKSRKRAPGRAGGMAIPVGAVAIAAGIALSACTVTGSWGRFVCSAAEVSAKLAMPRGGAALLSEKFDKLLEAFSPRDDSSETSGKKNAGSKASSKATKVSGAVSPSAAECSPAVSAVLKKMVAPAFACESPEKT